MIFITTTGYDLDNVSLQNGESKFKGRKENESIRSASDRTEYRCPLPSWTVI